VVGEQILQVSASSKASDQFTRYKNCTLKSSSRQLKSQGKYMESKKLKNQELISEIGMDGCGERLADIARRVKEFKIAPSRALVIGDYGSGKNIVARALSEAFNEDNLKIIDGAHCFRDPEGFITDYHGEENGCFPRVRYGSPDMNHNFEGSQVLIKRYDRLNPVNQIILGKCFEVELGSTSKLKMIAPANGSFYKKFLMGKVYPSSFLGFDLVIHLPSLSQREEDFEILIPSIMKEIHSVHESADREISPHAIAKFMGYHWPGNVDELKSVLLELMSKDLRMPIEDYEVKSTLIERRLKGHGAPYEKFNSLEYDGQ
jgi:transcriptional regulator with AAA-type ATPase domain